MGEGNGTPLQYSCLEDPRDGGACWAAVYGVAQSWTRLKQLSSSSCRVLFMEPTVTGFSILFLRPVVTLAFSGCHLGSISSDHNRSVASGSSESSVVARNISEMDSLSLQGVKSGMSHAQRLDDDQGGW